MLAALASLNLALCAWGGGIHDAARDGNLERVRVLLKRNPDLAFSRDHRDNTPLHWAAFKGHNDAAELLLAGKADVNAKDNKGYTPLHKVAVFGHKDMAELLLAHGADINASSNDRYYTPLAIAVLSGNKDIADVLLASHADLEARDKEGETPLRLALSTRQKGIAEFLLAHGADVEGDHLVAWRAARAVQRHQH